MLNSSLVFADEMCFYGAANESIIDMAMLGMRREPSKFIGISSPFATVKTLEWHERWKNGDPSIQILTGSTYDNFANLSTGFKDAIVGQYEGTSLAAAELHGELILENPGALFSMEVINRNLVKEVEVPYSQFEQIAIGLDPAMLSKKSGVSGKRRPDKTGIVTAAIAKNGLVYVLDNFTGSYTSEQWAQKAADIFDDWVEKTNISPTISVEINTLGEENLQMIYKMINRNDLWKHTKSFFSTEGKIQRMAPYALQMEQDKIKMVDKPSMKPLVNEMTTYDGSNKQSSPDAQDSLCQALLVLKPKKKSFSKSMEVLF